MAIIVEDDLKAPFFNIYYIAEVQEKALLFIQDFSFLPLIPTL